MIACKKLRGMPNAKTSAEPPQGGRIRTLTRVFRLGRTPHNGNSPHSEFIYWSMSDRRKQQRLEVCLDAVLEGVNGHYTARITDVSEGGCYIDSICDSYVGELISFSVQLPDGTGLLLTGLVAHYSPRLGFGVEFTDLKPDQLAKVQWLIDI